MTLVTFADLTHTGKVIDANQFPLAIGFVSAVLKQTLKDQVDVQLFKFPNEFAEFLETNEPKIACFSNYMWHERLHREFAIRIKQRYPKVITVFGGPNFPTDDGEQRTYLEKHPEIDFYIDGEGEVPFLELFQELAKVNFDAAALKASRPKLPNLRYLHNGEFVSVPLRARLDDIEAQIPSPYLTGLFDKFFIESLSPLMETSRGCPYSCTFCHSGIAYESKVRRFSQERISKELEYIADRVKVPSLLLSDLNWGMFKEDLITAKQLADFRRDRGWPIYVHHSTAKNQRDRMVEISAIMGDAIVIGATVQSTDPDVLKKVKRSNIAIDKTIAMTKAAAKNGSNTFTEIILCLPGDSFERHTNSVLTMMDAGIEEAAIYQFILLPGTEAGDDKSRALYQYDTRYRVMPRCFGTYTLFGQKFSVFEYHEVCVGNDSMPYEDYKRSRSLSLTVSIFTNGSVFEEIYGLAEAMEIPKSRIVKRIHDLALVRLADIYDQFHKDEERNFFKTRDDIESFIARDTAISDYLSGEYGTNQIYAYRSLALTQRLKDITDIAMESLREELKAAGKLTPLVEAYLRDLRAFVLLRKSDLFDIENNRTLVTRFNFHEIEKKRFAVNPADFEGAETRFAVGHTAEKIRDLKKYISQYGNTSEGLTYFLHRHPARMIYRIALQPTSQLAAVAAE